MSIGTELRARLLADGTVAGLVVARIFPLILPQSPIYPAITYSQVSGRRLQNLSGPAGRAMPRISITSWDAELVDAQSLAAAVRQSLDGFKGVLTTIQATISIEDEHEDYDDTVEKFRVIQDYFVNHLEA